MPRIEHVIESVTTTLELSDAQARALSKVGTRLASDRVWWGATAIDPDRTVIRCMPVVADTWSVRVQDAVGIIAVGDLQIIVSPKIPTDHLLFLFAQALQVPRLDDQSAMAMSADALWELVAQWFIRSTQRVLRRDLMRDYASSVDVLQAVRGRPELMPTARAYYAGRLEFHCSVDEFDVDTPLNRMLKAAAREVSRSSVLTTAVRKDAASLIARFDGVGELRTADTFASTERRTWYYKDALTLARHILTSVGRTVAAGELSAWTFLIRTPELVEAGVRNLLSDALAPVRVEKKGRRLGITGLTVNPDIVLDGGRALADVKYKLAENSWNRSDLYEIVAFAAGFRTPHASLIEFTSAQRIREDLQVGDFHVARFSWPCDTTPDEAATVVCSSVRAWLASCGCSLARNVAAA